MHTLNYPSPVSPGKTTHCLVYLISGNPGLIDYYHPFLAALRSLIDTEKAADANISFHLSGANLAGFDDTEHEPFSPSSPPHDLESQIRYTATHIASLRIPESTESRTGTRYDSIILIGHSVGSYITLELFHRHHIGTDKSICELPLHSAILLFPTVTHIAKSSSGKKVSMLRTVPFAERYAKQMAKGLLWFVPDFVLQVVLRNVLGMSEHGSDVSMRFLRSRDGIWQALYMAVDEMKTIGEERWTPDMWRGPGLLRDDKRTQEEDVVVVVPKFFFYYAKTDHWVDDDCRDEFIARRNAHGSNNIRLVICQNDIPHAFCIHHSEMMAEKVKMWIDEIAACIAT